jgi:hypothetical protein
MAGIDGVKGAVRQRGHGEHERDEGRIGCYQERSPHRIPLSPVRPIDDRGRVRATQRAVRHDPVPPRAAATRQPRHT